MSDTTPSLLRSVWRADTDRDELHRRITEKRAADERLHHEHRDKHGQVLANLRASGNDIAVAVAELHRPQRVDYALNASQCRGCDAEGYEVDETPWPCSTYDVITQALGITVRAQ